MAKQSITLKIAGKSYPFTIDSDKEEAYRLAEREVNNFLVTIKQKNFKGWNDLDYMSIAALNFAITNVMSRQSRETNEDDLRRLKQLESDIDSYLNNPRR